MICFVPCAGRLGLGEGVIMINDSFYPPKSCIYYLNLRPINKPRPKSCICDLNPPFINHQTILFQICLLVFLAELRRVLSRRFLCFLSRPLFHQESFSFLHTTSLSTPSKAPRLYCL